MATSMMSQLSTLSHSNIENQKHHLHGTQCIETSSMFRVHTTLYIPVTRLTYILHVAVLDAVLELLLDLFFAQTGLAVFHKLLEPLHDLLLDLLLA